MALLVLSGAGAVTGLVLRDSVGGTTSVAVSQAILIDYTTFSVSDITGDADEALVSVSDDGTQWSVHIEANNGDLITIYLPVANEAGQNVVAELHLEGNSPYSYGAEPVYYWSDRDHDGRYTGGQLGEAVIDPRSGSAPIILERDDVVAAVGTADFNSFTTDHWFFDGSYVAAGTYGPGGVLGPGYNDDVFSDYDGSSPEAILLDGGTLGILEPGVLNGVGSADTVVTDGRAALERDLGSYGWTGTPAVSQAVDRLHFDATLGTSWQAGYDIFVNGDGDAYYTVQADDLVDPGAAASPIVAGTQFEPFDAADNVYWDDQGTGYVFDGTDSLWIDAADDGVYAVHGTSIGVTGAETDLTYTSYPSYGIFDATIDVAFDGNPSQTYMLENAGDLRSETVSGLGIESATGGFSFNNFVEVGDTGDYFILINYHSALQGSWMELLGDADVGGDALVAAGTLDHQSYSGFSGSGFRIPWGTQTDSDANGIMHLNVVIPPFTKASVSAGDPLIGISGRTFLAGESKTVDNSLGVDAFYTNLKVLLYPGWNIIGHTLLPEIRIASLIDTPTWTADIDDFHLDSGADIAAAIDDAVGALGTATYNDANFPGAYKIDSADTTAASAVVVTPSVTGTDVTSHLKLGLAQGGIEYTGGDTLITGSPTEHVTSPTSIEVITASGWPLAYLDGELAAADGAYQLGEDIYWEETPGALTYSPATMTLPETVVYTGTNGQQVFGGSPPTPGSSATYLEAADNVWYRDWDHDTWYDVGEPLIVSSDVELDSGDEVLARADGPGTWTIGHGTDMWRLEDDFNGANGHDYYFIDDNNDGLYTDGEAILDQIYGVSNDLIRLEEDDFVIHHGLASLKLLSLVQTGGGSATHKFLVPSVCNLGSALRIRIDIALEDAAQPGFYQIRGTLKPVNY